MFVFTTSVACSPDEQERTNAVIHVNRHCRSGWFLSSRGSTLGKVLMFLRQQEGSGFHTACGPHCSDTAPR